MKGEQLYTDRSDDKTQNSGTHLAHVTVKVREGRRAADFTKSCVFPY